MFKAIRIIGGSVFVSGAFLAANHAVQVCTGGPFDDDACLWLWARNTLGLPQNRVLRDLTLQTVAIALLGAIYVAIRYILPHSPKGASKPSGDGNNVELQAARTEPGNSASAQPS